MIHPTFFEDKNMHAARTSVALAVNSASVTAVRPAAKAVVDRRGKPPALVCALSGHSRAIGSEPVEELLAGAAKDSQPSKGGNGSPQGSQR